MHMRIKKVIFPFIILSLIAFHNYLCLFDCFTAKGGHEITEIILSDLPPVPPVCFERPGLVEY